MRKDVINTLEGYFNIKLDRNINSVEDIYEWLLMSSRIDENLGDEQLVFSNVFSKIKSFNDFSGEINWDSQIRAIWKSHFIMKSSYERLEKHLGLKLPSLPINIIHLLFVIGSFTAALLIFIFFHQVLLGSFLLFLGLLAFFLKSYFPLVLPLKISIRDFVCQIIELNFEKLYNNQKLTVTEMKSIVKAVLSRYSGSDIQDIEKLGLEYIEW